MTKLLSFALRVVCILLVGGLFLVMLIAWKSGGSLPQAVLDCPAQAAAIDSSSPVQARCGLGSRWELNEACWRGVYVRRGNSNVFDAEWTLLDGRRFTAEITIEIQGNRVFVQRRKATRDGDADLVNGTLGADGVTVTGVMSGSHGSGCFFARIICDGQDASGYLSGRWRLVTVVPPGQPYAGTYSIDIDLTEQNGSLTGTGTWSNGPRSQFTGTVRGGEIILNRVDSGGFRGTFRGRVTGNGTRMEGTGRNDPSSPGGNTASYTWTASRL